MRTTTAPTSKTSSAMGPAALLLPPLLFATVVGGAGAFVVPPAPAGASASASASALFRDADAGHFSSSSLCRRRPPGVTTAPLGDYPAGSSAAAAATATATALSGIPKMFRWLTDQYPQINRRLSEGLTPDVVVDNFYLDMNGIIHPCTHGNREEFVVLDEREMFKKIFGYVDRLYRIVRPRRLLYLAVDGVAPRAKMNQQRSRRFRSSREAEELAATILARDGVLPEGERFDSNCITPGTDFMLKLSLAMRKWIEYKQETDPFWKNGADVVFTGPDVPGEGEHKVMDYIRETRGQYNADEPERSHPHWRPGMTHVLYGLDADLIMLGLVTHEPRFMLLREKMSVVMAGRGRHRHRKRKDMLEYTRDDFELLELQALRQMFQIQFRKFADREAVPRARKKGRKSNDPLRAKAIDAVRNPNKFKYDPSRIIDDFVFMCMLVGNDFLPHCPHLEIDNGALSLMLNNYIDLLPEWGGYLTDKDRIHPHRFEQFVYHVAAFEEEHFKRRGYEENEPGWSLGADNERDENDFYGTWYSGKPTPECARVENRKPPAVGEGLDGDGANGGVNGAPDGDAGGETGTSPDDAEIAKAAAESKSKAAKKFHRLHPLDESRSYRDYYYETKLGWSPSSAGRERALRRRRAHVRDYLEGLHWVLAYYHRGCPSWDWYFPHLYSPLATDMVNLSEFYEYDDDKVRDADGEAGGGKGGGGDDDNDEDPGFRSFPFPSTTPFPSLAQLLSVLPPQSADLLPPPLAELMVEPSSPLAPYYPRDFSSDMNGKRQPWEAVVRIPFIDADVLLETVEGILSADETSRVEEKERGEEDGAGAGAGAGGGGGGLLTNAERRRNVRGRSHLFVPAREGGAGEEDAADGGAAWTEAEVAAAAAATAPSGRAAAGGRGGGGRGRGRGRGGRGGRGPGRGGGGRRGTR